MLHALTEICQWARQQPPWEQETLRRILACDPFDDADYAALAEMLIEGKAAKSVDLSIFETPDATAIGPRPLLVSISEIANVNALADGQTIEFGPALTAIFGCNGAGKSGYARIFGSACFSRGDREVLPDIFEPGSEAVPQRARITISCEGKPKPIEHALGKPIAELAGFYVFDSTCVATHLSKANTLSFTPAGLSTLQDLVKHTDKVRALVNGQVESANRSHDFGALFDAPTAVAEQIATLSAKTDLVALKELSRLTADEEVRVAELERELAQLKLLDVRKATRTLQTQIGLLDTLIAALPTIDAGVANERLVELKNLLDERKTRREAADRAGAEQFAVDGLQAVGSGAWSEFIQAARRLADAESASSDLYPHGNSRCLLCQQTLSSDAVNLLHRLWDFLKGEAKRLLSECDRRISLRRTTFESCTAMCASRRVQCTG